MKHEWKKVEKAFYVPPTEPQLIHVPAFKFFTLKGQGNPNNPFFQEYIQALYTLAYAIRMSPKQGRAPHGYYPYTVYPLEGVWDIREEARKSFSGIVDKNDLVFTIMIRQPDFVDADFAQTIIAETKKKKPQRLLDQVKFEEITDGDCIQMLHRGPFDNEPESFARMEAFAKQIGYTRKEKTHREIYLSDTRRVAPEKYRTVLRFAVDT